MDADEEITEIDVEETNANILKAFVVTPKMTKKFHNFHRGLRQRL